MVDPTAVDAIGKQVSPAQAVVGFGVLLILREVFNFLKPFLPRPGNGRTHQPSSGELPPAEWEQRIQEQTAKAMERTVVPVLDKHTGILERQTELMESTAKTMDRLATIQELQQKAAQRGSNGEDRRRGAHAGG